ncbi:MAG: glycine cleavage system protein H [Firmicutes bacterium]|nr:glycine cleavage system protein H [Bacillota bacterium]
MSEVQGYSVPDDLYYTSDHAWVRLLSDGRLQMGLTDFTQKMAGKLTFVKLPDKGQRTELTTPVFSFQSAKWVGWIKPAASGVVVEVNDQLTEYPALVNEDPYGEGWVVVIEPSEPVDEALKRLYYGKDAVDWLEREIERHSG